MRRNELIEMSSKSASAPGLLRKAIQPMNHRTRRPSGFTLVEILVVMAILFLLAAALLPGMARPHPRYPLRTRCVSNLRQIGLSFRLYANDHGDRFPFAVSNQFGGTLEFTNSPQVIRHFESMSNEMVTPKILVCPSDPGRKKATDFYSPLANRNLSYFVGLDAREDNPQLILSGDRNITGGTLSNGFLRLLPTNAAAGWTTELHNNAGNVGMADGSVQQVTAAQLRNQLQAQDLPVIRLAVP